MGLLSGWLASIGSPQPSAAATIEQAPAESPTVRIARVADPPALEDYISGGRRDDEVLIADFRQIRPGDGDPVSERTAAFLSYDDDNLYVIFVCHDREPEKIRARLTKRESFFGDDFVGIALDTFHDRRRAYLFAVNPLGVQLDAIVTEASGDDLSFDTLWYSRARLTDDGFVVWMAIPFKSVRFHNMRQQTWGVGLERMIPRNNEQAAWPYITERIQGFIQQFATLTGLENIPPGRNLQVIPYATFAAARFLDRDSARQAHDRDARAGLDAKMVLREAFTLDVAVNPDFSQVESDEPQVTINQRFEVFFPEKRPFFIENAGFFQTPINLFFSRRVADPQLGGRLTGKTGPWTVGVLGIDDRAPGARVTPDDPAFGESARIAVVRAEREIGRQSSVGAFRDERPFHGMRMDVRSMRRHWAFNQHD